MSCIYHPVFGALYENVEQTARNTGNLEYELLVLSLKIDHLLELLGVDPRSERFNPVLHTTSAEEALRP